MKDPASSGVAQNNPWFLTYENIQRFTRNNFFGKVQVDWKIAKNWSLLVRSGLEDIGENYELRKSWGNRSDLNGQNNPTQTGSTLLNNDALITYLNNLMVDNTDDAAMAYIGTTPGNSLSGGTLNWPSNEEFDKRRPGKTFVDILASLNDPRLQDWVAPIKKPWTDNPAQNGLTVPTTDPNGYAYTSKWMYIDMAIPAIADQATNIIDKNKIFAGWIAGMAPDFNNGNGH